MFLVRLDHFAEGTSELRTLDNSPHEKDWGNKPSGLGRSESWYSIQRKSTPCEGQADDESNFVFVSISTSNMASSAPTRIPTSQLFSLEGKTVIATGGMSCTPASSGLKQKA